MKMRDVISIVENNEVDLSYYLEEGCGIFAVALSRVLEGGKIGILSNPFGEKWSRTVPFEVTHVFFYLDDKFFDVKGCRSVEEMMSDFSLNTKNFKGPYNPQEFQRKFMGMSDSKPLYGGAKEIETAIEAIQADPEKYGIAA